MRFPSIIALWLLPCICAAGRDRTVGRVVHTSSGPVAGHAAANHSLVSEYLGIPYAQAPVGRRRFAAPVGYRGSELLNGSDWGFSCPVLPSTTAVPTAAEIAASNITAVGLEQAALIGKPDVRYSEDCLYLNVWTKAPTRGSRKAVMVFLVGGAFDGGTASMPMLAGADVADHGDVVVVTLNYRLSILGFPGNPLEQDNVALLDQRLALEWVRENIANFGGDPAKITMFGQSAGAASADYLLYAYPEDPIVTGVILQSGSVFSFDLPYPKAASAANWYTTSTTLGCGNVTTNATTLLDCMRKVDVNSLLAAVPTTGLYAFLSAFGPTVDESVVFSNYSLKTPASVPVLVGSNDYEAGMFRTEAALANSTFPDAFWDLYNLAEFTCPIGKRANASTARGVPTWRYRFFGVFPNINVSSEGGAYHGAELPLLFGTTNTYAGPNSTAQEIEFETYMRGAWTTFAKDPTCGLSTYEGGWPMYDAAQETLVRLAFDNSVGTNLAFPESYDSGCGNASLLSLLAYL